MWFQRTFPSMYGISSYVLFTKKLCMVSPNMCFQRTFLRAALVTKITLKWFLSRMHSHMTRKMWLRRKPFAANPAHVSQDDPRFRNYFRRKLKTLLQILDVCFIADICFITVIRSLFMPFRNYFWRNLKTLLQIFNVCFIADLCFITVMISLLMPFQNTFLIESASAFITWKWTFTCMYQNVTS